MDDYLINKYIEEVNGNLDASYIANQSTDTEVDPLDQEPQDLDIDDESSTQDPKSNDSKLIKGSILLAAAGLFGFILYKTR